MFESIKSLRPYFHSLREIENNVSLDIKLPLTWKYEEIAKPYRSLKMKIQDKNEAARKDILRQKAQLSVSDYSKDRKRYYI